MKITTDEEFDLDEEIETIEVNKDKPKVGVLFSVEEIITDSTEFKRIFPTLKPQFPLLVRLEIDEEEIIDNTEEMKIVTQDGFIQMLLRYAKIIKNFEKEYLNV